MRMNRAGLKAASRQCILDATVSPVLVTLVLYLIIYGFSVLTSMSYLPLLNMETLSYEDYLYQLGRMQSASFVTTIVELLLAIFTFGYQSYLLRLSRRMAASYSNLLDGFRLFGKVLWLNILTGIFVMLWSLLFVIPGIIAAYRYRLACYVLLDDPQLTAREALRISCRLTRGHKAELFVLDLSFIPWHLLCGLTLGILYIWKLPYIQVTYAHAYNWILTLQRQEDPTWN